ncbi:MAG: DNA-binding protein [Ignavibacteriae bacterium]|nr:DNA-binding protein [Ignavibacteriota bacterium]
MTNYKLLRTIIGQLPHGSDLLESLAEIVQRENIKLGRISGIGATTHAVVAYYDQNMKKYNPLEFSGGMESLSLNGNVSIRDEKPFVHVHILLGDAEGKVFGGHLLSGTKLFACEVTIDEFEGEKLERGFDEKTGLWLWKI